MVDDNGRDGVSGRFGLNDPLERAVTGDGTRPGNRAEYTGYYANGNTTVAERAETIIRFTAIIRYGTTRDFYEGVSVK